MKALAREAVRAVLHGIAVCCERLEAALEPAPDPAAIWAAEVLAAAEQGDAS